MQPLPLKVDDLINGKIVENIRIEYKATLDEHTKPKIIETIAAFANDLYNLNGGYIILGIKAPDGTPILPPIGLEGSKLESIQRDIRIACKKIDPEYQPLYIPEYYQEKHIIVLWIPAGDNRPYRAPNHRKNNEYVPFVRIGPETVKAEGEILKQLLEVTAKIPFDDRRNNNANILAISPTLVKRFLQGMCLATQPQLRPQHLKAVEPLLCPRCQYGHDPFMDGHI
jgi:ATP-dependent DNA helicase RecG